MEENIKKENWFKDALTKKLRKLGALILRLLSMRTLILLGILLIMRNHGAFENYPQIDSIIGMIASFADWVCGLGVKLVNFILSLF